jgi:hypothetical protein
MKFYFSRNNLLFVFLLFPSLLHAQGSSSSPYSRFGVGTLTFQGTISQASMGRSGVAAYNTDRINLLNPAAMAFDTITTIEAGIYAEISKIKSSSFSQSANNAGLSYFTIGFPVAKHNAGISLGAAPYSFMDFNVSEISYPDCDCGRTRNTFTGNGGINRFYMALGYAPFGKKPARFYASENYSRWMSENDSAAIENQVKKFRYLEGFSVGINASWLFGTLDYSRKVDFIDSTAFLSNVKTTSSTLGDMYLNAGMQYHFTTRKGIMAGIGISVFPESAAKSVFNSLWYNRTINGATRDTVEEVTDLKGSTTIPLGYAAGLIIGKQGHWRFTADYSAQQWSRFRSDFFNGNLKDNYSINAGLEIIPEPKGLNYFGKINYRTGFYYHSSALQFNQTVIKDYGISFGLGLPVIKKDRVQRSMIQLGFEAGRSGTSKNNLIQQDYLRFHFGIVLNELWFFKRHYE